MIMRLFYVWSSSNVKYIAIWPEQGTHLATQYIMVLRLISSYLVAFRFQILPKWSHLNFRMCSMQTLAIGLSNVDPSIHPSLKVVTFWCKPCENVWGTGQWQPILIGTHFLYNIFYFKYYSATFYGNGK